MFLNLARAPIGLKRRCKRSLSDPFHNFQESEQPTSLESRISRVGFRLHGNIEFEMKSGLGKPRTDPYIRFAGESMRLSSFDLFIFRLLLASQRTPFALQEPKNQNQKMAAFLFAANAQEEMIDYEEMHKQMVLCRGVDNYLAYLTELIGLIFSLKPEIMKSNEQVTYKSILEHSTMDGLIDWLIEEKVTKLSHLGVAGLAGYTAERLKLDLFTDTNVEKQVGMLVEVRNVIVHNRGIVNRLFLNRVPDWQGKEGEAIVVKDKNIRHLLTFLAAAAGDIDERAKDKFGLPSCEIASLAQTCPEADQAPSGA